MFNHVNVKAEKTNVPNGLTSNVLKHVEDYEKQIVEAGGLDLCLLGIGRNGHIAFNEPGSLETSRTRCINLAADSVEANSRFFKSASEVPR